MAWRDRQNRSGPHGGRGAGGADRSRSDQDECPGDLRARRAHGRRLGRRRRQAARFPARPTEHVGVDTAPLRRAAQIHRAGGHGRIRGAGRAGHADRAPRTWPAPGCGAAGFRAHRPGFDCGTEQAVQGLGVGPGQPWRGGAAVRQGELCARPGGGRTRVHHGRGVPTACDSRSRCVATASGCGPGAGVRRRPQRRREGRSAGRGGRAVRCRRRDPGR